MSRRRRATAIEVPATPDGWLLELADAYADAHEAIPFGPVASVRLAEATLFHLAPVVCLKFRGIESTKTVLKVATDVALMSYVATEGRGDRKALQSPQVAFAFCYLAAHFGLDLLHEEQVSELMDFVVVRKKTFLRLIAERVGKQEPARPRTRRLTGRRS